MCGFCTPGIIVRAHALLGANPDPSRDEISRALASNLCRCTGWEPIVRAIQAAARSDSPACELDDDEIVAVGGHTFLADRDYDWWAVPVVAGVADGVFDGLDVPSDAVGSADTDEPGDAASVAVRVLGHDDLPRPGEGVKDILATGDEIHDAGEIVGLAVARRLSEARVLAAATRVLTREIDCDPPDDDLPAAADAADGHVWLTEAVDPGFLEPEAAGAEFDGDRLIVRSQTETPGEEERRLELAFPQFEGELVVQTNGGSYGGKAGPGPGVYAALAAQALDASVAIVFGRRESILWHRRRHPVGVEIVLDADAAVLRRIDGRITSRGGGVSPGSHPYQCPASVLVDVERWRPGGRLRGDGLVQFTFALEAELRGAGIDRQASLREHAAACWSVVAGCDGAAIAGSPDSAVAAGVDLDERGAPTRLVLAYAGAPDDLVTRNSVVSGAYMGLGTAVSEHVPMRDATPHPATIRSLGLLRCAQTPPIETVAALPGEVAAHELLGIDEYALAAVPAAVADAVRNSFGTEGTDSLPMLDSPASKAVRRR